jgi:hypothetical protein
MKKHLPKLLLERIKTVVPPGVEVLPLSFRYEDEDYNIAVFVPEDVDRQALQDRLYDLIFDYDDTHGTATLCYVWPQSEWASIVTV